MFRHPAAAPSLLDKIIAKPDVYNVKRLQASRDDISTVKN